MANQPGQTINEIDAWVNEPIDLTELPPSLIEALVGKDVAKLLLENRRQPRTIGVYVVSSGNWKRA